MVDLGGMPYKGLKEKALSPQLCQKTPWHLTACLFSSSGALVVPMETAEPANVLGYVGDPEGGQSRGRSEAACQVGM